MTFESDAPTRSPLGFRRRRTDDRPDLRVLAQAEQYWRSLIGEGQVPRRADVDAAAMGDALPYAMVLERVATGMARVRLAGRALTDVLGMEARGMPLSILVTPESRAVLAPQLETVFSGPAIVEVPLQIGRGWGRRPTAGRLLLLPLTDEAGLVTRALAVVTVQGQLPAGGAHRFEVQAEGAFRCTLMPKAEVRARSKPEPMSKPMPDRMVERRSVRSQHRTPQTVPPQVSKPAARLRVIEGSGTEAVSDVSEPRPALRLVVSNDS